MDVSFTTPAPVRAARPMPAVAVLAAVLALGSCRAAGPAADGLAGAYREQARLVEQRLSIGEHIAGYKGGLMSAGSMAARGVSAPLVGVLFGSGKAQSGAAISLCGYHHAALELKLGFIVGRPVHRLPADAAALSRYVTGVVPVIDLPDINYPDPEHYSAADMVAANISSPRYVLGQVQASDATDLNAVQVSLVRDGQSLTRGVGRESLGDQWTSLFAVAQQILAHGHSLSPGDIILTGKMGDRAWLLPGVYRATYGPLGELAFAVLDCAAQAAIRSASKVPSGGSSNQA